MLETPNSLFIGEAKGEAGLRTDGNYVLVHQLMRQYVMARIFLRLMRNEKRQEMLLKKVVPFLIVDGEKRDNVMNTGQVRFMISQEWLKKKDVLTWADNRSLQP